MGKVHLFLLLRKYDTKSPSLREIEGSVSGLSANKKPKPLTAIAGFRFLFLFSRTGQLTFLNSKALLLNAENISKMPRSAS